MSNISELEKELSEWRQSRNGRRGREIPQELKKQAVELLSEYSAWQLQKILGINSCSIKKWKEELSSQPVFIALPMVPLKEKRDLSESLELKLSFGEWSLEGNLSLKDWHMAIGLLAGVK